MDWKQILESVDDDYLIGISNKGIVKRAYKDKEEAGESGKVNVEDGATELIVNAGGETVRICYPLGESKCTCPSRSICRHVVLGILLAREQVGKTASGASQERVSDTATPESAAPDNSAHETMVSETVDKETVTFEASAPTTVLEEIKSYPLKTLLRALGSKALRALVEKMQTQDVPQVQYSSIVTVKLPGQEIVVKLLSPLEYSSCSCHKKELCSHKAEAILWCQWLEKQITTEQLAGETEQIPDFDKVLISQSCGQIKEYLEELMCMGLCRTSMEAVNTLERLAVLAHNAQLPRVENYLRTLADTYGRYLRRSANFSVADSMRQVTGLYGIIQNLLKAEENREISKLAGEFHAEYKPIGNLDLVGVTWEHFVSRSGYEGDTVYFLEENTGKWYTYTNARPTFYDGKKRTGYTEKAQAPWGLSLPLEGMVNLKIHLQGARCDADGRLSSGQESKGEITGSRELTEELLKGWYYDDFGKVFAEHIGPAEGKDKLIFLQPAQVQPGKFEEVEQVLRMPLWDAEGREILVEVPYSKRENETIRYLERMKENPPPCFMGRIYLKDSQLRLYPLDLFGKDEIPRSKEKKEKLFGILNTKVKRKEFQDAGPQDAVSAVLEDVETVLGDLYQVGFDTVQDAVLKSLKETAKVAAAYGMELLSEMLAELESGIAMERHRIRKKEGTLADGIMEKYAMLCEYVFIGRKRTVYDKAKNYYCEKEE